MRLSRTVAIGEALVPLIIPLLLELQNGVCARCGLVMQGGQIHHKRYGLDITLYDLELIHGKCHASHHKVAGTRGQQRDLASVSQ